MSDNFETKRKKKNKDLNMEISEVRDDFKKMDDRILDYLILKGCIPQNDKNSNQFKKDLNLGTISDENIHNNKDLQNLNTSSINKEGILNNSSFKKNEKEI